MPNVRAWVQGVRRGLSGEALEMRFDKIRRRVAVMTCHRDKTTCHRDKR